jgi:hypothetical protein
MTKPVVVTVLVLAGFAGVAHAGEPAQDTAEAGGSRVQSSRNSAAQSSIVNVHLRNDGNIDNDTMKAARDVVSRIYSAAGVALNWSDGETSITIALRPHASKGTAQRSQNAMGYTPGGGEARGRLAFVIINRVNEVADGYRAARSTVLGVAIAHELGHLLLSREHTTTGVMKPYFGQSDFRNAREGRLLFTREQATRIRSRSHVLAAQLGFLQFSQ